MGNEQKTIVPNERWMYNCFVHYNREYFDDSLPIPEFSTECDGSLWGSYAPEFFYDTETRRVVDIRGNGTIKLNGRYKRTVDSWVLTLLHEMAHEYVFMVMKIYPEDPHGREFRQIAKYINRKSGGVWDITEVTEKIDTDTEAGKYDKYKDDGTEDNMFENMSRNIVCVIRKPKGNDYKVWVTKTDKQNIHTTISMAKKINGATFKFYYCYSKGLFNDKIDADNLFGFGGMTLEEVLRKMSEYYKEPFKMFKNLINVGNPKNIRESIGINKIRHKNYL